MARSVWDQVLQWLVKTNPNRMKKDDFVVFVASRSQNFSAKTEETRKRSDKMISPSKGLYPTLFALAFEGTVQQISKSMIFNLWVRR
jgi:hypothetical protein